MQQSGFSDLNTYIIHAFMENRRRNVYVPPQEEAQLKQYLAMISNDYMQMFYGSQTWHWNKYRGRTMLKFPNDLWIMMEIIQELQPDLIIECGTYEGASALWFGDQLNVIEKGEVVSIDIEMKGDLPKHDRVTFIKGSSTWKDVVEQVKEKAEGKECVMVNLDSDHTFAHVIREMELYYPFVTKGSYMIVEDTIIGGHPVEVKQKDGTFFEDGPWKAVHEFLPKHPEFEVDYTRERFQITSNPHGYLRRCA